MNAPLFSGRIRFACAVLSLCLGLPQAELWAAEGPADEPAAVNAFLAESPQIHVLQKELEVIRSGLVGAGAWPNPSLALGREQVFGTGVGTAESRLGLEVPLPVSGRPSLLQAIAEADVAAAEARLDRQIFLLTQDFRAANAEVSFTEARLSVLIQLHATYERLDQMVAARVREGESAGYDLLRLRMAKAKLEADLQESRAHLQTAKGRVAGLLGRSPNESFAVREPNAPPGDEELAVLAKRHRKDILALAHDQRKWELAVELAEKSRWPDPELAIGLRHDWQSSGQGMGYTAGLSWPMPIFDQGAGNRARAQSELARAQSVLQATEQQLGTELPATRQAFEIQWQSMKTFMSGGFAQAPKAVQIAELAYQEGDGSIVSLLDAHQAALELQLQYVDLSSTTYRTLLDLERLVGLSLSDMQRSPS